MGSMLKYKEIYGEVEFSAEDMIFHGHLILVDDLVTFEASSVRGLEKEFKMAVNDYLETCKLLEKQPEKTYNGKFSGRISPELHKKAIVAARLHKLSFNKFVEQALRHELQNEPV